MSVLQLNEHNLSLKAVRDFAFGRQSFSAIKISSATRENISRAHHQLLDLIARKTPIYGVTTGFGDSCFRVITADKALELQKNLIAYLSCGSGPVLSLEASRAIMLVHLKSLSRGFSGVSLELLDRLTLFLMNDWIPVIPREGSLGASGDLIPLAYIARALQGEGELHSSSGPVSTADTLKKAGVTSYELKPKEGLALVNGTSVMSGLSLANLSKAQFLLQASVIASAWQCLALNGRVEAFGVLVNEKAKKHHGQSWVAQRIRSLLKDESYHAGAGQKVPINADLTTEGYVQDRYSLRCVPQILGPVQETYLQFESWLEREINSTADNPLIDEDGSLGMGGNFYGGYLAHGMDYMKICLANQADLIDRQVLMLVDEKSNRGLPPNLADWNSLPVADRHLHHGLKGLHQATSAITSEIIQKSFPGSVLSRSAESHNQDKVSLGLSAAVQCSDMLDQLFTIQSMQLVCLAQALDLRNVELKGATSQALYKQIRQCVPFVSRDVALGREIQNLTTQFKTMALKNEKGLSLEEI